MKGIKWSLTLLGAGVPLALLGLALNWEWLMLVGGGAVLTVVVGWPVLLLMGLASECLDSAVQSEREKLRLQREQQQRLLRY